jgi:hypothetical protein
MDCFRRVLPVLSPYAGDCESSGIIPSRQRSCSFELSFILVSISQGDPSYAVPSWKQEQYAKVKRSWAVSPAQLGARQQEQQAQNIPAEILALLHPPLLSYLSMLGIYHLCRGVLEHWALLHDASVSGERDTALLVDAIARISNRTSIGLSRYLWKHGQAVIGSGTQ